MKMYIATVLLASLAVCCLWFGRTETAPNILDEWRRVTTESLNLETELLVLKTEYWQQLVDDMLPVVQMKCMQAMIVSIRDTRARNERLRQEIQRVKGKSNESR